MYALARVLVLSLLFVGVFSIAYMRPNCASDDDCTKGEFCAYDYKECDSFSGYCKPIEEGCSTDFSATCGCDGITYQNACEVHASAVSIRFDGACVDIGDGVTSLIAVANGISSNNNDNDNGNSNSDGALVSLSLATAGFVMLVL